MQAWRNLYSLAILIQVALKARKLHAESASASASASAAAAANGPGRGQPSIGSASSPISQLEQPDAADVHPSAVQLLKQLDMGLLMGGPTFRRLLDQAIDFMQLLCSAVGAADDQAGGQPPLKRPRLNLPQPQKANAGGPETTHASVADCSGGLSMLRRALYILKAVRVCCLHLWS